MIVWGLGEQKVRKSQGDGNVIQEIFNKKLTSHISPSGFDSKNQTFDNVHRDGAGCGSEQIVPDLGICTVSLTVFQHVLNLPSEGVSITPTPKTLDTTNLRRLWLCGIS
jgi:hypothetical protein